MISDLFTLTGVYASDNKALITESVSIGNIASAVDISDYIITRKPRQHLAIGDIIKMIPKPQKPKTYREFLHAFIAAAIPMRWYDIMGISQDTVRFWMTHDSLTDVISLCEGMGEANWYAR